MIGVAVTVALFALFWALQGKAQHDGDGIHPLEPDSGRGDRARDRPGYTGRSGDLLVVPRL